VADPEISKGEEVPKKGDTPEIAKKIHMFWVSNIEF
jgi:hypothetical protein